MKPIDRKQHCGGSGSRVGAHNTLCQTHNNVPSPSGDLDYGIESSHNGRNKSQWTRCSDNHSVLCLPGRHHNCVSKLALSDKVVRLTSALATKCSGTHLQMHWQLKCSGKQSAPANKVLWHAQVCSGCHRRSPGQKAARSITGVLTSSQYALTKLLTDYTTKSVPASISCQAPTRFHAL